MLCRACGSPELSYRCGIARQDAHAKFFLTCHSCGSVNSNLEYTDVAGIYDAGYVAHNLEHAGGWEKLRGEWTHHANVFRALVPPAAEGVPTRFLDVGCLEGCGLDQMRAAGYECWGFDVIEEARQCAVERAGVPYARVVIGERFEARRFPLMQGVLCREVIEHVSNPRELLAQLTAALAPGGILQLQTPWPTDDEGQLWNQEGHLCVLSQPALRRLIHETGGLKILEGETRIWPGGQLYVCVNTRTRPE